LGTNDHLEDEECRKTPMDGKNNPRAKKVNITFDDGRSEDFGCLKDFANQYNINYSTLKSIYKTGKRSKRYGVTISDA
jgi:hypothetical protein